MPKKLTKTLLRNAASHLFDGSSPWRDDDTRYMCHAVRLVLGWDEPGAEHASTALGHLLVEHEVILAPFNTAFADDEEEQLGPEERQSIRFMFLHFLAESMS